MSPSVRVLEDRDLPALEALIARDPVRNLFLSARVTTLGLEPMHLGAVVRGWFSGDELVSACHVGANLVPVEATDEAVEAFAEAIGPRRHTASIMGEATSTLALHRALSERRPQDWGHPRVIRASQPLMVIDEDPGIPGDERIGFITAQHTEAYLRSAVAMYTEEIGVSPLGRGSSYPGYVRSLIAARRAMGAVAGDAVWFKSDIGAAHGEHCQIQGVWLDPALRGRGLSVPAMAQVVRLARTRHRVVSLYVNDFNTPARALYARVGFQQVGEFATVLY